MIRTKISHLASKKGGRFFKNSSKILVGKTAGFATLKAKSEIQFCINFEKKNCMCMIYYFLHEMYSV